MGGQTGFGPVPLDEHAEPFEADWEAHVFAISTLLMRAGLWNLDQFRDAIERLPPETYLGSSYYERWLYAMETLLRERGLLPEEVFAELERAGHEHHDDHDHDHGEHGHD